MQSEAVEPLPDPPPVSLHLEVEGEGQGELWIVRVVGSASAGAASDAGAPLLLLAFTREDSPGEPEREALAVARRLEDLSPDRLRELLARSRRVSK
jgi:hypothetical protein